MVTKFHESNFDNLPSQISIYGVTCTCGPDRTPSDLLTGLTIGKIFSTEYNKVSTHKSEIQRVFREISFTYIPNKCHIVSIDSFGCAVRGLIVGVTFCQNGTENYLNIYCNDNYDLNRQEWNLDKVAQTCCRSIHLEFTPYQLTNFKVTCPKESTEKTVFLLLGGDKKIHLYAQKSECVDFGEESLEDYFPELTDLPEIPTYLEQKNVQTNSRLDVVGFANGTVLVFLMDKLSNNVISSWSMDRDSPITQVQIISKAVHHKDCKFKSCAVNKLKNNTKNDCHIVVVSAREDATLYRNICELGFDDPLILSGSGSYDCPTCCAVANTNDYSKIEILIGTYGQRLLAYNCDIAQKSFTQIAPIMQRSFVFPIIKIKFLDMTCDGVQELSVITTKGVHAFQYELGLLLNKFKDFAS